MQTIFIVGPKVSLKGPRPELVDYNARVDFECIPLLTSQVRLREGGLVELLEPRDVIRIYRRAHECDVCILYDSQSVVMLDPSVSRGALFRKGVRNLYQYFRYKACCISSNEKNWHTKFDEWTQGVRLDDYRDPRCLPFQTFLVKEGVPNLDLPVERTEFLSSYKNSSSLADEQDCNWKLEPSAFHGRPPPLRLAGVDLPVGMHWDVTSMAKGVILVKTATEVWRLGSGEYLNISPNVHVRCSQNLTKTKRIYPK